MSDLPLTPPATIGPYKVIRPIARGGMAAVYEVEDHESRDRLALKLLTHRGQATPRFNREYRALTRLDHPNIVRVYRFGLAEDNSPYLTMELLHGVPAQVYAKSCGRPGTARRTAEVLRTIAAVADALEYMHGRGIVHRDLKSSNVMVLHDGRVKLLDFGTARLLGTHDPITRQGEFVGTFAYASPEQLTGAQIDARSDIYSLGVLLYRLLTGKRPFNAESPHALARMHLEETPRSPDAFVSGLPPGIVALNMQMLAKEPRHRPQSSAEVAAWIRGQSVEVLPGQRPILAAARLVGRSGQVRALHAVLARARPGRMVVVSGSPGAGRRRLISHVCHDAAEKGWRVYEGSFPGPPGLGAVEEIVRRAARGLPPRDAEPGEEPIPGGVVVGDVDLAMIGLLSADEQPVAAVQMRIVEAAASLMRRRTDLEKRPVLMILHDLHRAPPLATQALRAIRQAARDAEQKLVIIASTTAEADSATSPLRRYFPDATRVGLQPLDPHEVGMLVGAMLGRKAPPPILARRIHEATGGNPGFVEEIVRCMVHQGLVEPQRTEDDGVQWVDRSGGRVAIPGNVRDVIGLRIDSLAKVAQRSLQAISVAGGEATTAAIAHALELVPSQITAELQRLQDEQLLQQGNFDGEDTWRFRLGLTGQIVGERIRASRRFVLQKRLADALRNAPPSADKTRLLLGAQQVDKAVVDAVHWASELLEDRRGEEVLPVLERVLLRLDECKATPDSVRARFLLLHARAVGLVQPADKRAADSLERALALVVGKNERAEIDLEKARMLRRHGDVAGSRVLLDRALNQLGKVPHSPLGIKAHLDLGASHMFSGASEEALAAYSQGLRAAEATADLRAVGEARVGCGIARHAIGDLIRCEDDLVKAGTAYEKMGDDSGVWHAALNLADVLRLQGRFTESLELVQPHIRTARLAGRPYRYAGLVVNLCETMIELYRLGEVRDLLLELKRLDEVMEHPYMSAAVSLVRGRMLIAADDSLGAIRILEPAVSAAAEAELPMLSHQMEAFLGEAQARQGNREEGSASTRNAIEGLRAEKHLPLLADACACRCRALGEDGDPDAVFSPVLPWIHNQPARVVRMTYLIASADYARARGVRRRARQYYTEAQDTLTEIGRLLSDGDRSALRVHPWAARIHRGMYLL